MKPTGHLEPKDLSNSTLMGVLMDLTRSKGPRKKTMCSSMQPRSTSYEALMNELRIRRI